MSMPSTIHQTPQQEEIGKLFEKYRPMATRFAVRFSQKYGLPFQETQVEADETLSQICACWHTEGDPWQYKKGACSPTTWVYHLLHWQLTTYCTRKRPRYSVFSQADTDSRVAFVPAKTNWRERLMQNLGDDARAIVSTITSAPEELADILVPRRKKQARRAVTQYLKKQGWDEQRVDRAWDEVAACLAA